MATMTGVIQQSGDGCAAVRLELPDWSIFLDLAERQVDRGFLADKSHEHGEPLVRRVNL